MMSFRLRTLFLLPLTGLLVACSSGESLLMNDCTKEGFPVPVCDCIYQNVSQKYDDDEIKDFIKEIHRVDSGGVMMPSRGVKQYGLDTLEAISMCMNQY